MNSLVNVEFNWKAYLIIAIAIQLLFPRIDWYSYFAILISIHQFLLFFYSIKYVIPIRYLFGVLMCVQMLIGPVLAYNGLDKFQFEGYKMKIPEEEYFSYAIPAVICFIIGLHITAGKLKGEVIDKIKVEQFVQQNKLLAYVFIVVGFFSSLIANYFSTDLAFVFYLFGSFKYIGVFLIIIGNDKLKPFPLVLVYGSIILSSIGTAMFHDLLTWLIFLGAIFALKYQPGNILKLGFTFIFFTLSVVIQQIKESYRMETWVEGKEGGIESLTAAYENNDKGNSNFNLVSLAKSNVRINQGFIVTNIMRNVPAKVPFSNGAELKQILEAAVLPRIIAPNKLNAGDRDIFMKYSGMRIARGTSMGLSSVGDAYINFGVVGGSIFMFFLGLLYSEVLKLFYKYSKLFPVLLLFTPLVFYYPIRPDCELQTILGHLVKSCFLIFVVFLVWKKYFIFHPTQPEEDIHSDTLVSSSL